MSNKKKLWPYRIAWAFLAFPIIWLSFALLLVIGEVYFRLDRESIGNEIQLAVLVFSFIPIILILLDFFSERGAVIDVKGVKLDFSNINLKQEQVLEPTVRLPENIGEPIALISDSTVMSIQKGLSKSINYEFVMINLLNGNGWWVTRLLALSVGAVREGSLKAMIFVGTKNNKPNSYLGWAKPKDILHAILIDKPVYQERYKRGMQIAKQVIMFGNHNISPSNLQMAQDVNNFLNHPDYLALGEAATEQIVLDQLVSSNLGSLEETPDKLTLSRFQELFGHCLFVDTINLSKSHKKQIQDLLSTKAPYIVLTRDGIFEGVLKTNEGERIVLKELFNQLQSNQNNTQ